MFDRAAVGIRMELGGFARVMGRMQPVSVSDVRVVRCLFVVPFFVVVGSFAVVGGRVLVMLSSFSVMFRSFLVVHRDILFPGEILRGLAAPRGNPMEF